MHCAFSRIQHQDPSEDTTNQKRDPIGAAGAESERRDSVRHIYYMHQSTVTPDGRKIRANDSLAIRSVAEGLVALAEKACACLCKVLRLAEQLQLLSISLRRSKLNEPLGLVKAGRSDAIRRIHGSNSARKRGYDHEFALDVCPGCVIQLVTVRDLHSRPLDPQQFLSGLHRLIFGHGWRHSVNITDVLEATQRQT